MRENICRFVPYHKDYHSIHTINFVFETKPQVYSVLRSESVYKMYYVCSGTGKLHVPGKSVSLMEGDVFFTFPAFRFAIESQENFTYMYISFLGSRGNMIMDKLRISTSNFVFSDCAEVGDFWYKGVDVRSEFSDLISESVLLYTFSYLGERSTETDSKNNRNSNTALIIKKYVDDNFSNIGLSLEVIGNELSYNKKYVSYVFKKYYGISLVDYLNTVRIQHACTLIEQGYTGVGDIAFCCGYSDAQYFSKVFKSRMKHSPSNYIKSIRNSE